MALGKVLSDEEIRAIVRKDPEILGRLPLLYRRELVRFLEEETNGNKTGKGRSGRETAPSQYSPAKAG
jgi:hypothetical protein